MAGNKAIEDKVASVLRDNIEDPNTRRKAKGKQWVFSGDPQHEAATPRIRVLAVSDTYRATAVNSYGRDSDTRIQVTIRVSRDDTSQAIGASDSSGRLLDDLKNQVLTVVADNQEEWKTLPGVYHVVPSEASPQSQTTSEFKRVDIDLAVFHEATRLS